mmetsp:Transcript_7189/g.9624  ORF Transcript_7189/g.9624 Transcript_7189/m.9624 type:complete len:129 (-) Transcript_7189:148-534(-)
MRNSYQSTSTEDFYELPTTSTDDPTLLHQSLINLHTGLIITSSAFFSQDSHIFQRVLIYFQQGCCCCASHGQSSSFELAFRATAAHMPGRQPPNAPCSLSLQLPFSGSHCHLSSHKHVNPQAGPDRSS